MRPHVLALGAILAAAVPATLQAQPAPPDPSRDRTGPRADPQAPAYAQPAPSLAPRGVAGRPASPAATGGLVLKAVHVSEDGPAASAAPPRGWGLPPDVAAGLQHQTGQALDAAWVRAQFARNGFPGADGDVGRALALVQQINRAYLSAGFINSGLVVRSSADPEVLELHIVHGGLASPGDDQPALSVTWLGGRSRGLDAAYVRQRMPSAARRPLNAVDLERDFRLLAEDPAVRTINADLRPGVRPGEASLAVSIYPQDRYDLYVTAANNRSPSVGGERIALGGSMRNLALAGDLLSGEAGLTEGVKDVSASYAAPFLSPRNTVTVRAAVNTAAVIDSRLDPLDIDSREWVVGAGFMRKLLDAPLLPTAQAGRWSPARTLTAGLQVERRETRTTLLGDPFSFAPGSVDGRSDYTALRLIGDYVVRNVDQVFAVSLTATQGLDGSGSDVPGLPGPSPHFRAVLGQVNYARRLSPQGLELRGRLYGQWADGTLYSGERFGAGGESTVRGYRDNLLLADKGVTASVELAQPLNLSGRRGAERGFAWDAFTVSAFADGALMRNHAAPQPERSLYSVGASLAWTPADALSARATYGHALNKVEAAGKKDLQDRGFQFRVTVYPLRLRRR